MLRVLIVCSANVCRSPLVETLLRSRTVGESVMFDSAGTSALPGEPIDPRLGPFLTSLGVVIPEHRARPLGEARLDRRDLVLTAERRHRREVVQRDPRSNRRAFTLIEFARLLDAVDLPQALQGTDGDDDRDRLAVVLKRLSAARSESITADPADDDLLDPHGRSLSAYRTCVRRADEATEVVARALSTIVAR